jgi:hypothetical protein
VGTSLDLAAPKLGSGTRFRKLSTTLAARGASNPDALAAFIGRKRYGSTGMGKLSAGKSLANDDLGIYLAAGPAPYHQDPDETVQCPACQKYNDTDARYCDQCGAKLPASAYASQPAPQGTQPPAATAMANGTREALELAAGAKTTRRPAVSGPGDVGVRRGGVLYHRRGGNEIAQLRHNDDGTWTAVVAGKALAPHRQQRAALDEAVGTYNAAVTASAKRQDAPLQPPPAQTELMAEYGIPAQRSAAFATPTAGASDGPRMTTSAAAPAPGGTDANGLGPKGQLMYKKLKAKGFPDARAIAFAKNADKFTAKPAA